MFAYELESLTKGYAYLALGKRKPDLMLRHLKYLSMYFPWDKVRCKTMQQGIHPEFKEAKVICGCGNTFTTGSVKEELRVVLAGYPSGYPAFLLPILYSGKKDQFS